LPPLFSCLPYTTLFRSEQRSSMLRNIARGHVWQFGVSGLPAFWPFPHFKLKSRVLFAPVVGTEAGDPLDDPKKLHRLRRTVCKRSEEHTSELQSPDHLV